MSNDPVDMDEAFNITSICRADIAHKFGEKIAARFSDSDMESLADSMKDDYLNQLFWESMKVIIEEYDGFKHIFKPSVGDKVKLTSDVYKDSDDDNVWEAGEVGIVIQEEDGYGDTIIKIGEDEIVVGEFEIEVIHE